MNILKAADDIKNFSDQQLLSAGENPVMLPPYLVLAEMKRREQMRAEFAKSQQQQQPPTVIQQTAQNLAQSQQQQGQPQQGQPQQGMPQQPQAQGIMQGAPQQVMAMASGGYVPRYAAGTQPDLKYYADQVNKVFPTIPPRPPEQAPPPLAMSNEDIAKRYPDKPLAGYIDEIRSAYGPRDYSLQKQIIDLQAKLAESKKPLVGDALLELASTLGANQDPRVGLAHLFTKGIVAANKSYGAAKDNQNKLRVGNLAMMAALQSQQQKDSDDMIGKAMESKRSDAGVRFGQLQTIEANIRSTSEALSRARSDSEQRILQDQMARLQAFRDIYTNAATNDSHLKQAAMQLSRLNPRKSKDDREERVQDLFYDSLSLANSYQLGKTPVMDKTGKVPMDTYSLTINNLMKMTPEGKPKYFTDASDADRSRVIFLLSKERANILSQLNKEANTAKVERNLNPSGILSKPADQPTSGRQEESFTDEFNGRRIN